MEIIDAEKKERMNRKIFRKEKEKKKRS